jgi:hypothetical protein
MTAWIASGACAAWLQTNRPELANHFLLDPPPGNTSFLLGGIPQRGRAQYVTTVYDYAHYQEQKPQLGRYVLADLESWSYTDAVDQADPTTAYKKIISLALRRGEHLIAAPALDLCNVIGSPWSAGGGTLTERYLRHAPQACSQAWRFHCQSQSLVTNPKAFQSLLASVRSELPISVGAWWAGLTSLRSGDTADLIFECWELAKAEGVTGFWLNASPATLPTVMAPALTRIMAAGG